jgi:hypothetical protein
VVGRVDTDDDEDPSSGDTTFGQDFTEVDGAFESTMDGQEERMMSRPRESTSEIQAMLGIKPGQAIEVGEPKDDEPTRTASEPMDPHVPLLIAIIILGAASIGGFVVVGKMLTALEPDGCCG